MPYSIEWGFNAAEIDLVPLDPQPRSEGVKSTRRTYAASGAVYDEQKYVELVWDLLQDASDYQALLAQFDLDIDGGLTKEITIMARDETFRFRRYNGIAVRPETSWQGYFPRNIVILVKNLEPIPEEP